MGVTPENNACVLIWEALGPTPAGADATPPGLFEALGIPALPTIGDYFVGLRQYVERNPNLGSANAGQDTLTRLTHRTWTANQYPIIHSWLKANEKPLALVIEATKRTHYYSPIIPQRNAQGSKGLWSSQLPAVQAARELAQAFAARAMLHASHGRADAAWAELLACHRLGRLMGRGPLLIEGLVGVSIEQIACRADLAFVEKTSPKAVTLAGYISDLRALLPRVPVADQIDLGERFAYLDTVMTVERQGLSGFTSIRSGDKLPKSPPEEMLNDIDWNPGLKSANRWYDSMVAALRQKDRGSRNQQLRKVELEFWKLEASFLSSNHPELYDPSLPAPTRGKTVGEFFLAALFPAARKIQDSHDRRQQTLDNVITAFALAAYHSDNGHNPELFSALTPKYLPELPKDLFTGNPLIYKPSANGYLLYSVGPNGRDDGGRTQEESPDCDDLAVRVPSR